MIDIDGSEWLPVATTAERLPHVPVKTLYTWARRGVVRSARLDAGLWLCWPDVLRAEARARRAGFRPGRRADT